MGNFKGLPVAVPWTIRVIMMTKSMPFWHNAKTKNQIKMMARKGMHPSGLV